MPLKSEFLKGDPKLEACLVNDAAHVTLNASGNHVAKIQAVLFTLDGLEIKIEELEDARYGPSTEEAVRAYKEKRAIINRAYQQKADNIVGKMTIARMDKDMHDRTLSGLDGDFIGMTDAQIELVKGDLVRSKQMLDTAVARLRTVAHTTADGGLLVTPANYDYYDTKMKVFNGFRINSFVADDFPVPAEILTRLKQNYRGLTDLPKPSDPPTDGVAFAILLANFVRLRQSMNERFLKWYYPATIFNGGALSLYAAFVDAKNPSNTTVHFKKLYFDARFSTADSRAVTLAHERAHTIFRINGHPGTGDSPFCVAPHLGDPNLKTSDQALANAYCYEWLIDSLQKDYRPSDFRGLECGT